MNNCWCSGCQACGDICPSNAIKFSDNEEGFWFPDIDNKICLKCGLCDKFCNDSQKEVPYQIPLSIFAGWAKNRTIRNYSSSGGIFTALAEVVLLNEGIVVGAAFDNDYSVRHILVDNIEDLSKLRRSKYVQSNCNGIYKKVKEELKKGRTVLFSGTPCQCNSMSRIAEDNNKNLILCDLFCYGIPSPLIYQEYLKSMSNKFASKIKKINFKDKRYGWDRYITLIEFENGKKSCVYGGDSYSHLMNNGYSLRLSCFNCPFDEFHTSADITLGDFYTYHKYLDIKPPKNGNSIIVIHSNKGMNILNKTKGMIFHSVDVDKYTQFQGKKSNKNIPEDRNEFYKYLMKYGYDDTVAKFVPSKNISLKELIYSLWLRFHK